MAIQDLAQSQVLPEHRIIASLIDPGSSILDLGCGDGELLLLLKQERGINKIQGIEIDEQAIYRCVARGLSVFHGDIDSGLSEYGDNSFDYVILNQSLQQVKHPDLVLVEAMRVGHRVIVGFPNFAYYKARFQLGILGRAPITRSLPFQWYDTPNLHFLSIADFKTYCRQRRIQIEKEFYLAGKREVKVLPNLFALLAVLQISRPDKNNRNSSNKGASVL